MKGALKMRVEKTLKNIKIAILYQLTILMFTFIDKKVFLNTLGVDHAGLHGLFTNMITMLSLAELGVGIAIIYNLYKPLEDNNKEEISALMKFYKATYYKIGVAIGFIGIVLVIFMPLFIKEPVYEMGYIRSIYAIFLLGTVFTYFTGYKRSILYADQKNYLLLIGDMGANTIGVFVKLWILLSMKSYPAYVMAHMIFKIVPNIWASHRVNKLYPYIREYETKLEDRKLQQIKSNVKDLFIHKMSNFVMMATDNMIISSFIGLNAVGLVASYQMIIGALTGFIAQAIEGIQASMGSLVASEPAEKVEDIYDKLTFMCFWIGSFCAVALICLTQPFIKLWLGAEFLLPGNVVIVIVLNFFLWIITRPLWQMMTVTGLFKEEKLNSLVEIIVKLTISIILIQKIGIIGVFIGTTVTYIIAWVMKSYFLYNRYFKKSASKAYIKLIIYTLITITQVAITYTIASQITITKDYLRFAAQMLLCAILPNIINYILFARTKHFKYFAKLIKGVTMNVLENLKSDKTLQLAQRLMFTITAILLFTLPIDTMRVPHGATIGKLSAVIIFLLTTSYIVYITAVPGIVTARAKKGLERYISFAIIVTMLSAASGGMAALKPTVMMFLILNTGISFAYFDYRQIGKRIYILDLGILIYMVSMINGYLKLEEKAIPYYVFLFANPNYLGLLSALIIFICLLAYAVTQGKRYLIYPLPFIWIIKLSRSRTAILAIVALGAVYLLWKLIIKHKAIYYGFLALTIGAVISITLLYPMANSLSSFDEVNAKVIEKMGKNIFSGRERIWAESIELVKEKPITGYGMQASLEDFTEEDLNTHNVYLQLLLQGGVPLLLLFMALIIYIWHSLYKVANTKLAQLAGAALVGILTIGTFELTLLGQSISLGIIQWFILGLGISPALHTNNDTRDIKEME